MSDGDGRIGLVATVGVLLFGLLTVAVVFFTREDATADEEEARALVAEAEAEATSTEAAPPAALGRIWQTPAVPSGEDDGGADGPSTDTGDPAPPIRLWVHDNALATVAPSGVTGYGTLDGTALWTAPPPPEAGPLCAAGQGVNGSGLGAVLHTATGGGCSLLSVIDIDTGTTVWTADLTDPDAPPADPAGVTVTTGDATVTVNLDAAGTPTAFHRFDAPTGDPLPPPAPPQDEPLCPDAAEPQAIRHAGSRIVELTRCVGTDDLLLNAYVTDTGELEWTHPADDPAFAFSGLAAGDPVVLRQGRQLVAYAETGDELWRMPEPVASHVTGTVLCVQDGPAAAGLLPLAGYDLATGRRLWSEEAEPGTQLFGEDDTGALLTGRVTGDALWLESRDPATGEITTGPVAELPGRRLHDGLVLAYDEYQLYVMASVETDEGPALRLRAYER
ncbi:PQQ-binding-like beta-propeller repeat protein [Streptomyces avicenniae]|uniref:outer membrane protein assembly factor BamB family protein n=1 Tax=Streptomyces avicenniae TaxID=500153 RepID=UPI00069B3917|nr:PQQ-binding-like beta-propeller repeat protein [Streptomyces avicenniae]